MEELIQAVVKALGKKATIEQIYTAIIARGWGSDSAFLAIKAGENLYQARIKQQEELKGKQQ